MFIPAAHYRHGRLHRPRWIVIHDEEAPQRTGEAIAIANFFHNQPANDPNPTSVHAVADDAQLVRCVADTDTAYAAGTTGNTYGLHIEQSGYAKWTPADWQSGYTLRQLHQVALQVAEWSRIWDIPVSRRLGASDLRAGVPGLCGHIDLTRAFPADTTHTDPGAGYPWPLLIAYTAALLHPTHGSVPDMLTAFFDPALPHPQATWVESNVPGKRRTLSAVEAKARLPYYRSVALPASDPWWTEFTP